MLLGGVKSKVLDTECFVSFGPLARVGKLGGQGTRWMREDDGVMKRHHWDTKVGARQGQGVVEWEFLGFNTPSKHTK